MLSLPFSVGSDRAGNGTIIAGLRRVEQPTTQHHLQVRRLRLGIIPARFTGNVYAHVLGASLTHTRGICTPELHISLTSRCAQTFSHISGEADAKAHSQFPFVRSWYKREGYIASGLRGQRKKKNISRARRSEASRIEFMRPSEGIRRYVEVVASTINPSFLPAPPTDLL